MKTVISSDRFNRLDFRELLHYKGLLRYLSLRDVKVRYKQTWAGFGWALIRPAVNILIFGSLSILIDRSADYATKFLHVSAGIIIWNFVSTMITEVSNSMANNANILSKVYFPKLLLPASTILVTLVDFLISFVLFMVVYSIVSGLPPVQFLLIPFVLLFAAVICFGIGLLFASASIKYRDARYLLPFLVQILFYGTPVFISSRVILEMNLPDILKDIYLVNPFYYVVEAFRFCIGQEHGPFSPLHFGVSVLAIALILFLSLRYFFRTEQSFVDYL